MGDLNVSIYENIDNSNVGHFSQGVLLVISDVVKVLDCSKPVTFCPFCTTSCPHKTDLEHHLVNLHYAFLAELLIRSITLDVCPFCTAKFYTHHLVAKHTLMYHGNVLFEAYFNKQHALLECLFCNNTIEHRNMSAHVENIHSLQYYEWFVGKFHVASGGVAGLVEIPSSSLNHSAVSPTEELSRQIKRIKVQSTEKPRSILKIRKGETKRRKLPVRRELRFDMSSKENLPIAPSADDSSLCLPSGNKTRRRLNSPERFYGFKCGKCSISFMNHSQLVVHVKTEHNAISLKPLYLCAFCGASFFSKAYLKMHSDGHSIRKMR